MDGRADPVVKLRPVLLTLALLSGGARAALPAPTQTVQQVVTVTVDGKATEQLRDAATVAPGAVLQGTHVLTLPARRTGAPAPNPRYTVAVPLQGRFIAGSAAADQPGVTVTYALTREGPYSLKPTKTVTVAEGGQKVTRVVPAEPGEYRFVRFEFGDLQGKVTVRLRYRVQ